MGNAASTASAGSRASYVWRTFTVTRLEQRDGGSETETIGMSRGSTQHRKLLPDLAFRGGQL
ncbi:MAG TPA: hypothetical protein VKM93_18220 [Terriglobia bacterium]|nr:hypothetical protein [Terriglobia bacterium]